MKGIFSEKRLYLLLGLAVLLALVAPPVQADTVDPHIFVCNNTDPNLCGNSPNTITNPSNINMWVEGANNGTVGNFFIIVGAAPGEGVPTITSPTGAITTPDGTYGWNKSSAPLPGGSADACSVLGLAPSADCNSESAANWGSGYTVYAFEFTTGSIPGFSGTATSPLVVSVGNTSAGDFILGYGRNGQGAVDATPFTTVGNVGGVLVPDGGMTLILLGGGLVSLATLRRKLGV